MMPKCVWITRTKGGAMRTAKALVEYGHIPLMAPVLEVKPLWPEIDFSNYQRLIITSENAGHLLKAPSVSRIRPVYCVGKHTAQVVEGLGYAHVFCAKGNVRDLFNLLTQDKTSAPWLYLRANIISAPLAMWLRQAHQAVDEVIAYTTEAIDPKLTAQQWAQIDVIMLHSSRAALEVARQWATQQSVDLMPQKKVIAISQAVADSFVRAFKDFNPERLLLPFEIIISDQPNDLKMIALIT